MLNYCEVCGWVADGIALEQPVLGLWNGEVTLCEECVPMVGLLYQ